MTDVSGDYLEKPFFHILCQKSFALFRQAERSAESANETKESISMHSIFPNGINVAIWRAKRQRLENRRDRRCAFAKQRLSRGSTHVTRIAKTTL